VGSVAPHLCTLYLAPTSLLTAGYLPSARWARGQGRVRARGSSPRPPTCSLETRAVRVPRPPSLSTWHTRRRTGLFPGRRGGAVGREEGTSPTNNDYKSPEILEIMQQPVESIGNQEGSTDTQATDGHTGECRTKMPGSRTQVPVDRRQLDIRARAVHPDPSPAGHAPREGVPQFLQKVAGRGGRPLPGFDVHCPSLSGGSTTGTPGER
jgi:hypothetical protein